MAFYFFDCKASDCWAYVYSVSVKRTNLECCDSMKREFIPPLDYVLEGKRLGDTAYITGYFAVSRRVKDIFENNNISGCEFIPMNCTEWRERNGKSKDKTGVEYYFMKVKSTCGLALDIHGNECPHCDVCKSLDYIPPDFEGFAFDESKWDGSDIFVFENKDNIPIITEKLKKILAKEKLTNVEFVKISSVNKNDDSTKNN
ncbi:MAG: hypothetical protein ILP19_02935 [Oscillospiraceae bacterium]|nr:hypothetical protein [Oscillospiraceae bacterium]